MSELPPLPAGGLGTTDPGSVSVPDTPQFDAIVQAAFGDTARSSGSLESNTSSALSNEAPSSTSTSSASTSRSLPSLTTSSSTIPSAASSKTPSPCPSILRANSAPPAAFPTLPGSMSTSTSASASVCGSGPSSPNVTFAPLPETEPRKRSSPYPLGVAARSRLLRHRRMLRERGLNPDDYPYPYGPGSGVEGGAGFPADGDDGAQQYGPYGDDGAAVEFPEMLDGAEGAEGAEGARVRVRRVRTTSDGRIMGPGEDEEDPFVALGRFVKGAGKTLWKSLSMRDMRAKEREAAKAVKEKGGADEQSRPRTSSGDGAAEGGRVRSGSVREKEKKGAPRRRVVGTGHLFDNEGTAPPRASEEGGVWEEEVTEDSWKKLLSNPPPASDAANGDASGDGQATPTPTPASTESAGGAVVQTTTTIIVARPSTTKAR